MPVPRKECKNIPMKKCAHVPREKCWDEPRQECQQVCVISRDGWLSESETGLIHELFGSNPQFKLVQDKK